MFNDQYGLTKAVLERRKTQTRRIVKGANATEEKAQYKVGEIVAIAQAYKDCKRFVCLQESAGWNNKMFVKAELMPHHIRITDVRVERLQDISDEDCIAEGITHETCCGNGDEVDVYQIYTKDYFAHTFYSARYAYADLIDRISGKHIWDSNPFVFVYGFELIK